MEYSDLPCMFPGSLSGSGGLPSDVDLQGKFTVTYLPNFAEVLARPALPQEPTRAGVSGNPADAGGTSSVMNPKFWVFHCI